ncbi:hypothetical protein BUALT_Bualt14G0016900 [Buddleja alternifolia]|uniref:SWIM-type domain-containing protein n=1 Tax=Buddleja alternifolia TaxID=168488 RepID=A0AAV6WNN2_9LAMI|nr:hypothetical protein BUALT_Bualt14G0016900 [Buddleja alternifolia]
MVILGTDLYQLVDGKGDEVSLYLNTDETLNIEAMSKGLNTPETVNDQGKSKFGVVNNKKKGLVINENRNGKGVVINEQGNGKSVAVTDKGNMDKGKGKVTEKDKATDKGKKNVGANMDKGKGKVIEISDDEWINNVDGIQGFNDDINCDFEFQRLNERQNEPANEGKNVDDGVENENEGGNVDDESDFFDSDYNMDEEDSEGNGNDDNMFEENIDKEVEWTGPSHMNQEENIDSVSSHSSSDEDDIFGSTGDEFDSDVGSDAENMERTFPIFNPKDKFDPPFSIGLIFSTKKEFREAVHSHAIRTARSLKITSNDQRRVYAKCMGDGCNWHLNALKVKNEASFQIRAYNPKHKCGRTHHCKNVNSRWLSKKFVDHFRSDPKRNIKGFRKDVMREIRVNVSPYQAYRAKRKALQDIEGKFDDQYAKLWDYAQALRAKNPGSTVIMALSDEVQEGSSAQRKFHKFYVCFYALKQGFLAGCRPIIGVDGCHLKGPHSGVLLTAVSVDPNNNLYPLAYAVVGSETKEAWEWFLMLLREDLQIERDDAFTFISDKQKGLVPALEKVLPGSDKRFCIRHLHGNMKTAGFKGLAFKRALWGAAKASTVVDFDKEMAAIGELDPKLWDWLQDKPPSQWSRSHFNIFPKCDILLNNICEAFNSNILEAREKPILTMLEWIRQYLMIRLQKNRDMAEKRWEGRKICSKIRKLVEKNMGRAADYIPIKSDATNYEVEGYDHTRFTVDLKAHSCSCRKWDLCGIPCRHGMSAISAEILDPEDFVQDCYSVETFSRVYAPTIKPMDGPELWEKTGYIPPLPPNFGRKRGRPTKARRLEPHELVRKSRKDKRKQVRLPRQKWKVTCKFCGGIGHNRTSCQWKKFAEEFPMEDDIHQPANEVPPMEQPANEVPQMEQPVELTQPADEVPHFTQTDDDTAPPPPPGFKMTASKRPSSLISKCSEPINVHKDLPGPGKKRTRSQAKGSSSLMAHNLPPSCYPIAAPHMEQRVKIRAPPLMTFHKHQFVSAPKTGGNSGAASSSSSVPVIMKDGKKFVTMTNLNVVVAATKKKKGSKKDGGKKAKD